MSNHRSRSYIEQMIRLRDSVAPFAASFGIPNSRSLIIRTRSLDESLRYLAIAPTPIITEIDFSQKNIEGFSGISGPEKTFEVKGVSRHYTRFQLEQEAVDFVVGGELRLGKLVGGIVCELKSLKENPITWDLTIVQKIAEQSLY